MRRLSNVVMVLSLGLGLVVINQAPAAAQSGKTPLKHIIVVYMENWSFDSLYGLFPGANGLANATNAAPQVDKTGKVYDMLPAPLNSNQKDSNGKSIPDPRFPANLPNKPFEVDKYVPTSDQTGDLLVSFYPEQYQIDGGKMDKFAAWTNAGGLVMGYYDTTKLPLYQYAKQYTLGDNFFHAAFGGSFLNAFWLACSCTPTFANAPADMLIQMDANGVLTKDGPVTPDGYVVNTAFSSYSPHPATAKADHLVPPQTQPTLGDRLSEKGISWAWYSGGWNDAVAGKAEKLFQFHHQPYAYFKNYGDGTDARQQHLKDETDFYAALSNGSLPAVSFVKPVGEDNEHPGYATVDAGEKWAVNLINQVQKTADWEDTAIILTYDENGGFWDHVTPPAGDKWGPGTRVPLLVISPYAKKGFVDHTQMDTTSILSLIEYQYGLKPLSDRDAKASNMLSAFDFNQPEATMSATTGS